MRKRKVTGPVKLERVCLECGGNSNGPVGNDGYCFPCRLNRLAWIADGVGGFVKKVCPRCDRATMYLFSPGLVRCANCE